jgi:hypothetical protein
MSIGDSHIALVSDKSHILDRSWEHIKQYLQNSGIIITLSKLRERIDENRYNKSICYILIILIFHIRDDSCIEVTNEDKPYSA